MQSDIFWESMCTGASEKPPWVVSWPRKHTLFECKAMKNYPFRDMFVDLDCSACEKLPFQTLDIWEVCKKHTLCHVFCWFRYLNWVTWVTVFALKKVPFPHFSRHPCLPKNCVQVALFIYSRGNVICWLRFSSPGSKAFMWDYRTVMHPSSDWLTNLYIWAASWQNQQCGCAPSEDSDQPGHL